MRCETKGATGSCGTVDHASRAYADDHASVVFLVRLTARVFSLFIRHQPMLGQQSVARSTHLKPFLNRLDTVFKYRMRPVPVVFRRLAFWPHSKERSFALG